MSNAEAEHKRECDNSDKSQTAVEMHIRLVHVVVNALCVPLQAFHCLNITKNASNYLYEINGQFVGEVRRHDILRIAS